VFFRHAFEVNCLQGGLYPRANLRGGKLQILQSESHFRLHRRGDDLCLGVLKDHSDVASQLVDRTVHRVETGDRDAAEKAPAIELGHDAVQ